MAAEAPEETRQGGMKGRESGQAGDTGLEVRWNSSQMWPGLGVVVCDVMVGVGVRRG